MKILLVSRLSGWIGVHMRQLGEAFRTRGHEAVLLDYRRCRRRRLPWTARREDPAEHVSRNTWRPLRFIEKSGCELVLVAPAHPMFDFQELGSAFRGPVVFFDMDGPRLPWYEAGTGWVRHVDHLVTVSRVTERRLRAEGHGNVSYLPHGVDPEFYAPLAPSQVDGARFAAPVALVGDATDRRADYLAAFEERDGVALWGRRWARPRFGRDPRLAACRRTGVDVVGRDLLQVYAASGVIVNVQREELSDPPTILNLQAFAVPCSTGCLLTEWVEELEDAFEPGKEILSFRSREELVEKARRYAVEVDEARLIGLRGRARCLAEHTLAHRAESFVRLAGDRPLRAGPSAG